MIDILALPCVLIVLVVEGHVAPPVFVVVVRVVLSQRGIVTPGHYEPECKAIKATEPAIFDWLSLPISAQTV